MRLQLGDVLILRDSTATAVIEFSAFENATNAAAAYRWRVRGKGWLSEARGTGTLRERYERVVVGDTTRLTDLDGVLMLSAGPITLQWSRADEHSGWLYVSSTVATEVRPAGQFDHVVLPRR